MITVMPEQIQSPSMTAEWEQKLLDVERGSYADSSFMDEIEEMITDLVKNYKSFRMRKCSCIRLWKKSGHVPAVADM